MVCWFLVPNDLRSRCINYLQQFEVRRIQSGGAFDHLIRRIERFSETRDRPQLYDINNKTVSRTNTCERCSSVFTDKVGCVSCISTALSSVQKYLHDEVFWFRPQRIFAGAAETRFAFAAECGRQLTQPSEVKSGKNTCAWFVTCCGSTKTSSSSSWREV